MPKVSLKAVLEGYLRACVVEKQALAQSRLLGQLRLNQL